MEDWKIQDSKWSLCMCFDSGQWWWWYHSLTPFIYMVSVDECLRCSNVERNCFSSYMMYCAVHKYTQCDQRLCDELCHVGCNAVKCAKYCLCVLIIFTHVSITEIQSVHRLSETALAFIGHSDWWIGGFNRPE